MSSKGDDYLFYWVDKDEQDKITETPLTVYVCEGEPSEIQEWFETINIAGVPLVQQELRNFRIYDDTDIKKFCDVYFAKGAQDSAAQDSSARQAQDRPRTCPPDRDSQDEAPHDSKEQRTDS